MDGAGLAMVRWLLACAMDAWVLLYIFFLFWCMFKILHKKMFLSFYLKALFS